MKLPIRDQRSRSRSDLSSSSSGRVASTGLAAILLFSAGMLHAPSASSTVTNQLENASFESPVINGSYSIINTPTNNVPGEGPGPGIPGWQTDDRAFEIWRGSGMTDANGIGAYEGAQYIELNAYINGTLYQDIDTTPGQILTWRIAHRARGKFDNPDVMRVLASAPASSLVPLVPSQKDGVRWTPVGSGDAQANISDGGKLADGSFDVAWHVWSGTYVVPAGQTRTRFAFQAVSSGYGVLGAGNFLDAIEFGQLVPEPESQPATPQIARWTLTYDANGGTCSTATKTDVDGSWVATPGKSDCIRSGYEFKGWNTSKDGSGSGFAPGASVQLSGDNTLFAQWSKVNVTAVNDTAIAVKGRPVTGSLTLNDTFPAGSTFTVVSGTTRGTIVVNPDGTFTYTPTQAPRATTRSRG